MCVVVSVFKECIVGGIVVLFCWCIVEGEVGDCVEMYGVILCVYVMYDIGEKRICVIVECFGGGVDVVNGFFCEKRMFV